MKRGSIEFVGGPLCGKVAAGFVGDPECVSDWHEGTAVRYRRRDLFAHFPPAMRSGARAYEYVREGAE